MKLYIGDKLYKINLAGQVCKIMDVDADIANASINAEYANATDENEPSKE